VTEDNAIHFAPEEDVGIARLEEVARFQQDKFEDEVVMFPRMIQARIQIEKPLRLPFDLGNWGDDALWRMAFDEGRFMFKQGQSLPRIKYEIDSNSDIQRAKEAIQKAREQDGVTTFNLEPDDIWMALEGAGFDGIIYTNEGEGFGSESYLVWNAEQIYVEGVEPVQYGDLEYAYTYDDPRDSMTQEEIDDVSYRPIIGIQAPIDQTAIDQGTVRERLEMFKYGVKGSTPLPSPTALQRFDRLGDPLPTIKEVQQEKSLKQMGFASPSEYISYLDNQLDGLMEPDKKFSRRGPAEFNAFSKEGQEELDIVLAKTKQIPEGGFDPLVPAEAIDQGYSEQKFTHVGPEGITDYDFDAERANAGLSPEGIYASRNTDTIKRYADRLRKKGVTPFEYELTTTARNIFVLNQDKPNKAMLDAYRQQLEKRFGRDTRYIEGKLSEFEDRAVPPTDMTRKERSDIYRAGGAEILLDGEDFVFLNREQVRDVAADFDPSKIGRSGLFFSRRISAPPAESNPFNVDLDRTNIGFYPEEYEKPDGTQGFRLTGDRQYKPNSTLLLDAVKILHGKTSEALGTDLPVEYTEENKEGLARLMATEALKPLDTDTNAIGWYDEQIKNAKKILRLVDPRIFESENNETIFNWALAVTSNGTLVEDNFTYALEVFDFYTKNGRLPVKEWKKGGKRNDSMRKAFSFANQYEALVVEGKVQQSLKEFFETEYSVKQLQATIKELNTEYNLKMSVPADENADTVVFGSYMGGPKIGQGFYQNIIGNYEPLTMDIWWMRMWNRLVNRPLKPQPTPAELKRKRIQARDKLIELARGNRSDPTSAVVRIVLGIDPFKFTTKATPFKGA
jgi:hypothetical protein